MTTFAKLTTGTVINYNCPTTADDDNFVVLKQYEDQFGNWTEVLNMETLEKDQFMAHNKLNDFWTVVKAN